LTPGPAPAPAAPPAPSGPAAPPIAVYSGTFGPREAERLLWRAGFGPRPDDVERLVALELDEAAFSLTRPSGAAPMTGAEPTVDGAPLSPLDTWYGACACAGRQRSRSRAAQPIIAMLPASLARRRLGEWIARRSPAAAGSAFGALRLRTQLRSGDGRSDPDALAQAAPRGFGLASAAGAATSRAAKRAGTHTSRMRADGPVTPT